MHTGLAGQSSYIHTFTQRSDYQNKNRTIPILNLCELCVVDNVKDGRLHYLKIATDCKYRPSGILPIAAFKKCIQAHLRMRLHAAILLLS